MTDVALRRSWLAAPGREVICTLRLIEEHPCADYPCRINAQPYLLDMYAKHGFSRDRDEFLGDGIPHVAMLRPGAPREVELP